VRSRPESRMALPPQEPRQVYPRARSDPAGHDGRDDDGPGGSLLRARRGLARAAYSSGGLEGDEVAEFDPVGVGVGVGAGASTATERVGEAADSVSPQITV